MQGIIDKYLHHLTFDLGSSRRTITVYTDALNRFSVFSDKITTESLKKYRDTVSVLPVSYKTKNLRLIPIRQMLKYAKKQGCDVADNSILELFENRSEKKKFHLPEPKVFEELCQKVGTEERTGLMINLLYYTGLRLSELLSLQVGQIREEFSIIGKGSKQRLIYCTPELVKKVRQYETGMFGKLFDISPRRVDAIFLQFSKKMGVKVHPHMLRHGFATRMLSRGADLVSVKNWLGHERLSTTEIYLNYSNAKLANDYKKFI